MNAHEEAALRVARELIGSPGRFAPESSNDFRIRPQGKRWQRCREDAEHELHEAGRRCHCAGSSADTCGFCEDLDRLARDKYDADPNEA